MLSAQEYLIAWLVYLVGVLGGMVVWWYITRKIPYNYLRNLLRLLVAVVVLVPYPLMEDEQFMAPAFIMSLLEWLFEPEVGFLRAGTVVIVSAFLVIVFYSLIDVAWRFWVVRRRAANAELDQQLAERDELLKESNASP